MSTDHDIDGEYFLEFQTPSGNQILVRVTHREGPIKTEIYFLRPISDDEIQQLPQQLQSALSRLFDDHVRLTFIQCKDSSLSARLRNAAFPEARN